jgi:hypothetical protein
MHFNGLVRVTVLTRLVLPALALGLAPASIVIAQPRGGQVLSYAAVSGTAHAADVVAGVALLAAGALAALGPARPRLAFVAVLAGLAWFAPDWEGWGRGPELVRSLGGAAAPLLLALLVDLVVTIRWRRRGRLLSVTVWGVYVLAAVAVVGRALFRAPYLDPYCWRDCLGNTFLVRADPQLAEAIADAWQWASIVIGIGLLLVVVFSLPSARKPLLPAILAALVAGATSAAYAAALLYEPMEDPRRTLFSSIFFARAALLALLTLGLV